jgi:hypothetical protein
MMKRREFLIGSALAAGAGRMSGQSPDQAKLDRMVVMSLSFGRMLKSPAHPDDANRTLDILDLPDLVAKRWGIHHVEMQHSHFLSTETAYLEEFHSRLKKAKSQVNQINVEFGQLNISSPDPSLRLETIDLTKQWIDHAVAIGCPRVMVNQGTLAPEVRQTAIDTLKTINAYGKAKKVFVTMENRDDGPNAGRGRGGRAGEVPPGTVPPGATEAAMAARPRSPTWEVLVEVMKASGTWANPDIGHFPDEASRAAGLRVMYPLSSGGSHCHYDPEHYSEANAIKISKEVGYKGLFSLETAYNNGPDPYAAVQSILDELLRDI